VQAVGKTSNSEATGDITARANLCFPSRINRGILGIRGNKESFLFSFHIFGGSAQDKAFRFPVKKAIGFRLESAEPNLILAAHCSMLKTGIVNPQILSLLARVRHTNTLVIADRGFPFWPQIETVDISLTDDVPTVLQVIAAIRPMFHAAQACMAGEFLAQNDGSVRDRFAKALEGIPVLHEAHVELKKRVPSAIGLIRTGDTIQYANLVLVSG